MDQPLLKRVANGDGSAVEECISRYGGLVWSIARSFTSDAADAEDAVQEIFLAIWKSADRYDPEIAAESTFIAMIARRRLIDRRRSARRRPAPGSLAEEHAQVSDPKVEDASQQAELRDEAALAAECLALLKADERRVLELATYQGMTHQEIATATGVPLGTVKTRVRRGLIRLREMIERKHAGAAGGGAP